MASHFCLKPPFKTSRATLFSHTYIHTFRTRDCIASLEMQVRRYCLFLDDILACYTVHDSGSKHLSHFNLYTSVASGNSGFQTKMLGKKGKKNIAFSSKLFKEALIPGYSCDHILLARKNTRQKQIYQYPCTQRDPPDIKSVHSS